MNPNLRRRRDGGWIHLWFVIFLVLGGVFGVGAATVEHQRTEECEPVTVRVDTSPYVTTLEEQGWQREGDRIYPPGCESVR